MWNNMALLCVYTYMYMYKNVFWRNLNALVCCVFVNLTPCVSFLQVDVWYFLLLESCFVG